MIRRAVLCIIAMLASPVLAGQYTHEQIIGFSQDGRYFAFKTFGLQRGSGLPYATVYVVDLQQNAWVQGSPFRAGRDETDMAAVEAAPYAALDDVRRQARDAAAPMLRDLAIIRPATYLFAAGIGQAHAPDAVTQIVIPNPDDPTAPPVDTFGLGLAEITVPAGVEYCAHPDALRGYRLEYVAPDGTRQVLHEDQRIPASRGCAQAYRLDAVISAGYPQVETPLVALISVWRQGFEGLQRHVIATPVPALGQMQQDQNPDKIIDQFMHGLTPLDIDVLEARLPARQQADPGILRWRDADLPDVARAVEVFAAQDGFADYGRLVLHNRQVEIIPDGAGVPVTLSLIRLQAFNLGAARHAELVDIFGEETIAPPDAFGAGPDTEWRFVMRPVQGMRADIITAGRRDITDAQTHDCGPSACGSAAPLISDTCNDLATPDIPGATTRLGKALAGLADSGAATGWLMIEYGLWQDNGLQVLAGPSPASLSCWWSADTPK